MIYTMPGMETKLHAVINKDGVFDGLSSNYSGAGFSHMRFKFHALNQEGFDGWIAGVKRNGTALNRDAYLKLEKPSEREPVRYFANVEDGLYQAILNLCAQPGKMCMNEMMHIDMMGGAGVESHENRERLKYDNRHAGEAGHGGGHGDTVPASGVPPRSEQPLEGQPAQDGHSMPGMNHDSEGAAPAQLNNN
jgi:cytochrome o ubiquinol oxidase subunit 2